MLAALALDPELPPQARRRRLRVLELDLRFDRELLRRRRLRLRRRQALRGVRRSRGLLREARVRLGQLGLQRRVAGLERIYAPQRTLQVARCRRRIGIGIGLGAGRAIGPALCQAAVSGVCPAAVLNTAALLSLSR